MKCLKPRIIKATAGDLPIFTEFSTSDEGASKFGLLQRKPWVPSEKKSGLGARNAAL